MRLSTFLLLITFVNVSAKTFSQDAKLTFNLNDVTVKEVFAEIEKNSTYKFLYRNEVVDVNHKVNIEANSESLDDVLKKLFDQNTITYRIFEGNMVVITDKSLQQQKISGVVTDASTGEKLIGVTVMIEGTATGVTTDVNGQFSIDVSKSDAVLLFSYVGYVTEKVQFQGQKTIDVKLVADVKKLDEVIVIGYGTQKKSDVTGAVASVNASDLKNRSTSDAAVALQGKAAGVQILSNSGAPGKA